MSDLLDDAWGLIANAYGGDWDRADAEWKDAATRWRDTYCAPPGGPYDLTPLNPRTLDELMSVSANGQAVSRSIIDGAVVISALDEEPEWLTTLKEQRDSAD